MSTISEYGSWDSPITPDVFSKGNAKAICEIQANRDGVFWVEQHILTGKRELFHRKSTNGHQNIKWADGLSVQNAVHEYGGGSLALQPDGSVIFSTIDGVYVAKLPTDEPIQVADGLGKTIRFADISSNGKVAFCVLEDHSSGNHANPDNRLAMIDLTSKVITVVSKGCDFYACPRVSSDGEKLVWMQWNHINMPWDETSIVLADVTSSGLIENEKVILSGIGKKINYYNPTWSPNGKLYVVCDKTNYWNVYNVDLESTDENGFAIIHNIFPIDEEIGYPLWVFGDRPFATNGRNFVFNVNGSLKLRSGNSILTVDTPGYCVFTHMTLTDSDVVYCIAQGPSKSSTLLRIELHDTVFHVTPIRECRDSVEISSFPISEPEEIKFNSDGETISGWFYRPKNNDYSAPVGALPPVLLLGHGGPTAPAWPSLDFKKQFFTSRGFAVFDVNYRGSTGFGTDFRRKLYRNWGVVDRNDMINGAKALMQMGLVDSKKVCIMGSSAGGFLLLSCLLQSDVFCAAVSQYGVADLESLAKDTHKFEMGYNEVMIGKFPEEIELYKEKSPIRHIERLNTPIAFIHGKEDTVVPVSQSIEMYEKMKENGITTGLMLFEEEGHGFRNATNICRCTEASYYFLCKVLGIHTNIKSDIEIHNLK